jgi:rod shape-determining protein MreD
MRWPVFLVFAFIALALEISLRNALRLDSLGDISPSFVACIAVLVAMFAHRPSALWACWGLGVFMDLLDRNDVGTAVIGPYALGYTFGAFIVTLLRTMVFRRKALTMGAMTFIFLLASGIVVVFITTIRAWYPDATPSDIGAMRSLVSKALESLYGGLAAIPLGWLLLMSMPLWGFPSTPPRRSGWL